jgi:uncharacterized repeat protein (TIGR04076 family)
MKRREFITRTGMGVGAGLTAFAASRRAHVVHASSPQHSPVPAQLPEPAPVQQPQVVRSPYTFEIDIVEGSCGPHKAGQTIKYPDEKGKICPWLMDSMNSAIRVLEYGGTLPWLYEGTRYQKVIDPSGITTEFIRCPDPTRVVVAKITRRRV